MVKRRTGRWLQKERERWFRLYPLCRLCQLKDPPRVSAACELDHIVSLTRGGLDVRTNKQGLCKPCHIKKTAADLGYTHRKGVRVGVDGYPIEE